MSAWSSCLHFVKFAITDLPSPPCGLLFPALIYYFCFLCLGVSSQIVDFLSVPNLILGPQSSSFAHNLAPNFHFFLCVIGFETLIWLCSLSWHQTHDPSASVSQRGMDIGR